MKSRTHSHPQFDAAKALGTAAYANGMVCSPSLDISILQMVASRKVGETPEGEAPTNGIFNSWTRGWLDAYFAD